jgi:type I restriction enzyme S subunit
MTMKNNIPAGYKDSAVGIIPQEWDVKRVKDLGSVITGSTPPTADVSNYGSEYMFVSPADLSDNQKYVLSTEKMLSSKGYAISRKMPKGTILYTCIGSTIGKIGIASRELTSNQQINAVICNDKTEYLYYALLFTTGRIKMLAGEQAVPIINKSEFENIKLAVPPMEEQRKIAEILGVWDEAIEKQSRLIEKLELRKRGLMQRLLTGRTRLPGFTTPWQKVKLGEICKRVTRRNEENNQNVMTISAQKGFVSQTDFFNKSVASSTLDNYYLVLKDEFCYNKSYSNGYPMGAIKRLKEADKAVVTTLYICFSITDKQKLSIDFFEQYCENGEFNQGLMKIANEGGRAHGLLNVTPTDFFSLVMLLPTLPEQKAIAEVLTTADDEIATHRKKLDALHLQKRGLMQQLLTGKTRVKI